MAAREYNFDGLVGQTHNYGGLSPGNVASMTHQGQPSNPRAAALQGLEKMRFVHGLGVGQAVLPPQPRPSLAMLRRLGFTGSDEDMVTAAARDANHLFRLCASASAMWTANAATVAPSADTTDGRVHITPANLHVMFHRSIEAETTHSILRSIFADEARFAVHPPLPGGGHLSDEGAANHTRLHAPGHPAVHIFAWGRRTWGEVPGPGPKRYPARQTFEAGQTIARLHRLAADAAIFPQQHPDGIDAGAFHTDVLAVGNGALFLYHELAFADAPALIDTLAARLGDSFRAIEATGAELPVSDAVAAYPFNSQLVDLPDGTMAIVAPEDSRENPRAHAFLQRVAESGAGVTQLHFRDVRQSMHNGGGPACLRQRIVLTDAEVAAIRANVFYTPELRDALTTWVTRHYRDRLLPADLADPALARESMTALDELTGILRLGPVYDFQR